MRFPINYSLWYDIRLRRFCYLVCSFPIKLSSSYKLIWVYFGQNGLYEVNREQYFAFLINQVYLKKHFQCFFLQKIFHRRTVEANQWKDKHTSEYMVQLSDIGVIKKPFKFSFPKICAISKKLIVQRRAGYILAGSEGPLLCNIGHCRQDNASARLLQQKCLKVSFDWILCSAFLEIRLDEMWLVLVSRKLKKCASYSKGF